MTRLLLLSLVVLLLVPSASGFRAGSPAVKDGLLVYQSNPGGNYDLFVADANGSNPRNFLARPDTNEFNPDWSPNGQRIVFQTGPPNGSDFDIWQVNANGAGATALVTGPTNDVAPQFCDDTTVVFTRQLTPTNSDIFTIETNGSGLRQLTDAPGIDSFPSCSPGGDRIAFNSSRAGGLRIFDLAFDGSVRPLIGVPSVDPDFAPDRFLAYSAPDADGNLEVFTYDLLSGETVQRTSSQRPRDYRLPKFSPSSTAAAWSLTVTARNRDTAVEELVRIVLASVATIVAPGSAGVVQPLFSTVPLGRTVTGTSRNDVLRGTSGNDVIRGLAGNDRLFGLAGQDRVDGGPGADQITGGAGRDTLNGGPGADLILARDGEGDVITCGSGRDRVVGDRVDRVARDCELVQRR